MTEITFKSARMEAGQLIVDIPMEQRGAVMKFLRTKKDKLYDLAIKEHREKRSLDANAYAWVLIHKIAKAVHSTPLEVYQEAVVTVGDNYTPMCVREQDKDRLIRSWESRGDGWQCIDRGESSVAGCRTIFAYYGSSVFDTGQMSRLIDGLLQDCRAMGIETKPEEEIASLLGAWE